MNQLKGLYTSIAVFLFYLALLAGLAVIDYQQSEVLFVKSDFYRYTLAIVSITTGLVLMAGIRFKNVEKQYSSDLIVARLGLWILVAFLGYYLIGTYITYWLYKTAADDYTVECSVVSKKLSSKSTVKVKLESGTGETYELSYNPFTIIDRRRTGEEQLFPRGDIFAKGNKLVLTGRKSVAGFAIDSIKGLEK